LNVAIFYFSGTGNTARIAEFLSGEIFNLGADVRQYNMTKLSNREAGFDFTGFDGAVFGFPVYIWRAPKVMREWLTTLNGNGIKCGMFFTYGGIHVGAAHYDTMNILTTQGFNVVGSGEFVGAHTFNLAGWNFSVGRPDDFDLKLAETYAKALMEKFRAKKMSKLKLKDPSLTTRFLDKLVKSVDRVMQPPSRKGNECGLCGNCETYCPTAAMNAEKGEADPNTCNRCLKCVKECPENALIVNDIVKFKQFILDSNKLTEEDVFKRESKLFI